MALSYTLAEAVTEICAKVKDYGEVRYGANDPKSYFRAKKLFWEAVLMLTKPNKAMEIQFPQFYEFAQNVSREDLHGLIATETKAFASGIITLTTLTNFMEFIEFNNYTGEHNITKNIRIVSPKKFNGMAKTAMYPPNTVYITRIGNIIKVTPSSETGSLDITYIKTPDNSLATTTSMLTLFSLSFATMASRLAAELLKIEARGE